MIDGRSMGNNWNKINKVYCLTCGDFYLAVALSWASHGSCEKVGCRVRALAASANKKVRLRGEIRAVTFGGNEGHTLNAPTQRINVAAATNVVAAAAAISYQLPESNVR